MLADRDPLLTNGGALAIGASGYSSSVHGTLAAFSLQSMQTRVEPRPPASVVVFDAWLSLNTSGRLRFYTREHVREFMRNENAEAEDVLCDYVTDSHHRKSGHHGKH